MDAQELNYDELTALAKDRKAWRKSMLHQNADTSNLMEAPKSPTCPPVPQTAAEREAVQEAWNNIFRTSRAKKEVGKRQKREDAKNNKTTGWSDRQRANWARAHYHLHHGRTLTKENTTSPIINRNDKLTIWSSVKAKLRVKVNAPVSLWDAQASPPAHVTYIPGSSRDSPKRTKWDTPIKTVFDSSTDTSSELATSSIDAHITSPPPTCARTTPAAMITTHTTS